MRKRPAGSAAAAATTDLEVAVGDRRLVVVHLGHAGADLGKDLQNLALLQVAREPLVQEIDDASAYVVNARPSLVQTAALLRTGTGRAALQAALSTLVRRVPGQSSMRMSTVWVPPRASLMAES